MAKINEIAEAVSSGKPLEQEQNTLQSLIQRVDVKKRFEEILGQRAPAFMSSIISAANANQLLRAAEPKSVLSAAMMAATLDLPINSQLGFAHIVPYKNNKTGITVAQFQVGWKGFVQLAMRTGQYKTMNAAEIYEGELKSFNRITGEIEIDLSGKKSDTVVGYVAFFRLMNGFEKYHYMTREGVENHAKRYSKSYGKDYGPWASNFGEMALKTVLKALLSKYGILSVQMERAIQSDQGVIIDAGKVEGSAPQVEFIDNHQDEEAGTAIEPEEGK